MDASLIGATNDTPSTLNVPSFVQVYICWHGINLLYPRWPMTASMNQAKGTGMRLATWNLWWRFGPWSGRQEAIKSVLSELDADIIALQEVWFTDEMNQAEVLASELGYHFQFVPSPAPQKWQNRINDDTIGIGNAVVSRWPIVSTKTLRLPAGDAIDEGRVAIHTMIDTPHGLVPLTTTHLNVQARSGAGTLEL